VLHNFRRAIVVIFLSSFAIFMLSSIGMIASFMVPFDIQVEQPWQLSQAEKFMNDCNYFANDFVSKRLPSFDSKLTEASTAFNRYILEVETLSDFIQAQNGNISSKTAFRIACAVKHYSLKYSVPFDLAIAVAHTESHFDPNARSSYGALGVMQVVWRVHAAMLRANGIFEEEQLLQPEFGIEAGCLVLSDYLRNSVDTQTALGRYYGGDSNVYWGRISRSLNFYQRHAKQKNNFEIVER